MTTILVIAALTVAVGTMAMFYEMRKSLKALKEPVKDENQVVLMEWLKEMQQSQERNTETMRAQLDRTNKAINERLDNAAKVVQSVGSEVGKMQEIGESMKDLSAIMKSPKLRGNLGEQVMKDLLEQILPKAGFMMQYKFKSGDTVDAVVKTKNGLIPLDSKFPMENYLQAQKAKDEAGKEAAMKDFHRQVKKHIDDISKKYILPGENTVDFAIMYVPGESVYYEIITTTNLANHGEGKKVYLVSPNTFHYFLKTVMVALEGEKIEERAKQVLNSLRAIQNDSVKLGTDLGVLNRHVTNTRNTMDAVNTSYARLGSKIENTGQLQEAQVKEVGGLSEGAVEAVEEVVDQANEPSLFEVER